MSKTRPQRPSADVTRSKILNAALSLFMQHGYAGTSMGKISEKANVNQTLIFHHFENKMQLWGQVKAAIIADVNASLVNPKPNSLRQFLQEAIAQRVSLYTNCPKLSKLVGWQRMESAKSKQSLTLVLKSPFSPDSWLPAIRYLQGKKLLNPTYQPELIITWIISSIEGMISDDIGLFKRDPENKRFYSDMLMQSLLKGLS